jgi:hypothetical protein
VNTRAASIHARLEGISAISSVCVLADRAYRAVAASSLAGLSEKAREETSLSAAESNPAGGRQFLKLLADRHFGRGVIFPDSSGGLRVRHSQRGHGEHPSGDREACPLFREIVDPKTIAGLSCLKQERVVGMT